MTTRARARSALAVSAILLCLATPPSLAQTIDELTSPAPEHWPTFGRNLEMWRYSPLGQINRDNVDDLRIAWSRSLGTRFTPQGSAIEYEGILYVHGPDRVVALDAVNGDRVWEYTAVLHEGTRMGRSTARGAPVVFDGKLFSTLGDGRVVALDARTGEEIWSVQVGRIEYGEGFTSGPIFAEGKIIVGPSGADAGGVPGRIIALDPANGETLWTFHTIPLPGEPGFETWDPPSVAEWGGGSAWNTGAYDPETRTVIYGVGQPIPWWAGDQRRGDNLYTNSWVGLDVETGALKWYHQILPNEEWDYDQIATPLIANLGVDGSDQRVALLPTTTGFLVLDHAETGEFITAYQMMEGLTVHLGFDDAGRAIVDESMRYDEPGDARLLCPRRWVDYEPGAYSPNTGLYYRPNNFLCGERIGYPLADDWQPGTNPIPYESRSYPDHFTDRRLGALSAIDPRTGEVVWEYDNGGNYTHFVGPVVTGGNLVFSGFFDRGFRALDAQTGELLWEQILPAYIHSAPISYMVDGRQYIAVLSGGFGSSSYVIGRSNVPPPVPGEVSVFVFALPANPSQ